MTTDGESLVFVSYSNTDKKWAIWVASALEAAGLAVQVQEWNSRPGDDYTKWINAQLAAARWTVALYSKAYFASEPCTWEWTAALDQKTLLPVRLEPVDPPKPLRNLVWVDLFDIYQEQARERLLHAVGKLVLPRIAAEFPGPATPPFPGKPARRTWFRRHRTPIAAAAALLLAGTATALLLGLLGRAGPSSTLGECSRVDIFTGHPDSPYYRYAQVLKTKIEKGYPGTAVTVEPTSGTSDNIDRMRDDTTASCELAVIQLNVGLDARNGDNDFEGKPVERLRTIGPLWFDLIHILVRRDSDIRKATDLCGKTVATGVGQSGVKQIGEVLFQQVEKQVPGCKVRRVSETLPAGLNRLGELTVDAVLWAGGSPTAMIREKIGGGLAVRLLPLGDYLAPMQQKWHHDYPTAGDIYQLGRIYEGDYLGVGPTETVAVPNGIAANEGADDELAHFVAKSLDRDRGDFEDALWGEAQGERNFMDPKTAMTSSRLYCEIPLHHAAASYYQDTNVYPPC
jgi:TRAP transporter TAXI family solute receptor